MPAVLANILVGLATSLISAASLWLWQRAAAAGRARSRTRFFGVAPGQDCLVVMGHHHGSPHVVSHHDVHAVLELGALLNELGATASFESAGAFRGGNGGRTEFCLSGPNANERTAAHLAHHLPGVTFRPYGGGPDAIALLVGGQEYRWVREELGHALLAKFTPPGQQAPVFLICGQSAEANRGAVHYLRHHYTHLTRTLPTLDRFCLILRVSGIAAYAHEQVTLLTDATEAAFTP